MNLQDAINIMLPPQNGYVPGINSTVGWRNINGKRQYHVGIDFNLHYPDGSNLGQTGVNLTHPDINSFVSGTIEYKYVDKLGETGYQPIFTGIAIITDAYGNQHVIRHLDAPNKEAENRGTIEAGESIGTMGGRGYDGCNYSEYAYDQHVHYEVWINGKPVDPVQFLNNGWGDGDGSCQDDISALDMLYDLNGDPSIPDSLDRYFTRATQWRPSSDPLSLDLDGDGIETVGINTNNPILFDHNADGVKTATGWIKGDDGLLVLDRNNNGTIDSGKELFGDSTVMSNGQTAADGFAALADLDSNADGQIDVNDTQFANLRVWRDLNQDGISQANELSTLDQQNIASISLTTTNNNQLLSDGNRIMDLGTYTKTDGTTGTTGATGQTGDVDFAENTFYTDFTDAPPITPEAELLPNMEGSGLVRDLREAASIRGDLTNVLSAYSSATTRAEQIIKGQKAKGELSAVSF